MSLTVLDCIEHIRHRLGTTDDGAGLSHDLSGLDVVNNAGQWLVSAHRWKWTQRQTATLAYVAGQNYVDLPADLASITDVETSEITSGISEATIAQIQQFEKNVGGNTNHYYYAVEWDHTGEVPTSRMRLWPTPESTSTGSISIAYRAKWAKRTDDNQRVFLPDFMHPLFIELCREWALGWEEADEVPLGNRLGALQGGPLWEAARSTDAQIQPSYGVLTNGMAHNEAVQGDVWRFFEGGSPS